MSGNPARADVPGDHLDDDALVELALTPTGHAAPDDHPDDHPGPAPRGTTGSPARTTAHLAGCTSCAQRLASLQRVVDAARADEPGDEVPPPDGAWDAIASELGLGPAPARTTVPAPLSSSPGPAAERPAAERPAAQRSPAERPAARAPQRTALMLTAAAAVGLLLGWTIGQGVGGAPPAATAVASATLDPLPAQDGASAEPPDAAGSAELDRSRETRTLVVSADALAPQGSAPARAEDGYYEVWLIDVADGRLVSLGALVGGAGSFTVPPAVDTGAYSTVDVSWEPVDGEPAHSGESVLRGTLSPEA